MWLLVLVGFIVIIGLSHSFWRFTHPLEAMALDFRCKMIGNCFGCLLMIIFAFIGLSSQDNHRENNKHTNAYYSNNRDAKILSKGDTRIKVQTLQKLLNYYYGNVLNIDGNFGYRTEKLVKKFQSAINTTPNGIVDKNTFIYLNGIKSMSAKAHPMLRKGDQSDYVRILQIRLNIYYNSKLVVDGYFGYKTETLVKQFQKENQITANGIVNSLTWSKLEQPIN